MNITLGREGGERKNKRQAGPGQRRKKILCVSFKTKEEENGKYEWGAGD